jgi:hypothetical protein
MNSSEIRNLREKRGWTQLDLAKKIGVSLKTISNYELGGVIPASKKELLRSVLSETESNNTTVISDAKPVTNVDFIQVPLIPVRASAGYLYGYGDMEYIESLPTIPIIVDKTYKGKYRCFEISGDSMDDGTRSAICDKDVVLGREVKREHWKNKLHINDWYFIIVHKTEGITVKQITDHNISTCEITCHPLNPLFNDFKLNLNDVLELYNVIKIVDRNTRI